MKAANAVASIITPHILFTLQPNSFIADNMKDATNIKGAVNKTSESKTLKEDVSPTKSKNKD